MSFILAWNACVIKRRDGVFAAARFLHQHGVSYEAARKLLVTGHWIEG